MNQVQKTLAGASKGHWKIKHDDTNVVKAKQRKENNHVS